MTTTSNQGLGVTTTTSDHKAVADKPDVNMDPTVTVPVPHPNEVPTALATEHTSDKTKFGGGKVVREGDAIGPNSGPPHGDTGAGGGDGSHTHLQEARVTTGSSNVQAEGKPIARNTDKTTQNHANTKGAVQGGDPNAALVPPDVDKKKACSLETTVVQCVGAGTAGGAAADSKLGSQAGLEVAKHGRKAGKDHVLEVVSPDKVTLTATRKNAKEASKGPECELEGQHTKWMVSKWQSGKKLKEEVLSGDNQILDPSWFDWPGLSGIVNAQDGETGLPPVSDKVDTREAKQAVRNARQHTRDAKGTIRNVPNPHAPTDTAGKSNNQIARETYRNMQQAKRDQLGNALNAGQELVSKGADIYQFLKIWNAYNDPVEVKVEAFACSGAEKYTLRSVPGGNAEFTLGGETLAKVRAACATVEKFCKIFQKLASLAGLPAKFGLKLCEGAEVEFECEWGEMEGDNEDIKKKEHHVDLGWELTFRFKKLVEYEGEFGIPLAYFLNLFAPGSGSALNTMMTSVGLEATVGVDIEFGLTPALWAKREKGASKAQWGGGIQVKLELYFRLKVKWGNWLEVSGGAVLDFDIKGGAYVPGLDLFQFEVKIGGEIKVGFRGSYSIDLWWWSKSDTFSYFPEQAKAQFPERGFKPLAMLKG